MGLDSLCELTLSYTKLDEINPSVWSEIGDTLTHLYIEYDGVGSINENVFGVMPQLKTLSMYNCSIATIHPEAFNGLNNLEELWLHRNRISGEEIKNLQSLSSSLKLLYLNSNRITAMPNGTFEGFITLERLDLESNQISVLLSGGFHGLQSLLYLYLNYNEISAVEPGSFEGLSSLITIWLASNNIAAIYPDTFRGLNSLHKDRTTQGENMDLQSINSILRYLNLDNNKIAVIQKDTFEGFTALEYLHLARNRISEIMSGGFHGMSSLTHIDLDHNSLTTLEWTAFSLTCAAPPGKYFSYKCLCVSFSLH